MAEEKNNEWKKTVEGVIRRVQLFLDADSTRSFTPSFVSQMLQCFRDAHNSEVAELRQCLKEVVEAHCNYCKFQNECDMKSCKSDDAGIIKWRKALEGKL